MVGGKAEEKESYSNSNVWRLLGQSLPSPQIHEENWELYTKRECSTSWDNAWVRMLWATHCEFILIYKPHFFQEKLFKSQVNFSSRKRNSLIKFGDTFHFRQRIQIHNHSQWSLQIHLTHSNHKTIISTRQALTFSMMPSRQALTGSMMSSNLSTYSITFFYYSEIKI